LDALREQFNLYELVVIENKNSDPVNAEYIGVHTNAFISDVNIQFSSRISHQPALSDSIVITEAMHKSLDVLDLSVFKHSRFISDRRLKNRGGENVYREWIKNSFSKENKFFALSRDESGRLCGYVLFSYSDSYCVIELINVSGEDAGKGIGQELFRAVEHSSYKRGISEIRVGTQQRNLEAINFYIKMGCRQVGCHQVYHLWL